MKNEEFNELFRKRTMSFALKVIEFLETVPFNSVTKTLTNQLCAAASSVAANWRAFCRGRSKNERFAKICIVVEEADESQFWIEMFMQLEYGRTELLPALHAESTEISKVMTSIKDSHSRTKT
ncbi:MAG: four helix bundle protein [Saprospiraceae bacterium]